MDRSPSIADGLGYCETDFVGQTRTYVPSVICQIHGLYSETEGACLWKIQIVVSKSLHLNPSKTGVPQKNNQRRFSLIIFKFMNILLVDINLRIRYGVRHLRKGIAKPFTN